MRMRVYTEYKVFNVTDVDLPEGKTSDDIKEMYMKWGHGHIVFKDGTTLEDYFEEEHDNDHEFFKRPDELTFEELEGEKCEKCEEVYFPELTTQTMCDDCEIEMEK